MRFLLAIFALWFAICLIPDGRPAPSPAPTMEEKVWLSRDCTNSKWYLEDSDDQTATLACYPQQNPNDDGGSH